METVKKEVPSTKGLTASKTFWGVAVMFIAAFSDKWLGINLDDILTTTDLGTSFVTICGAGVAIWGRWSAQRGIDKVF